MPATVRPRQALGRPGAREAVDNAYPAVAAGVELVGVDEAEDPDEVSEPDDFSDFSADDEAEELAFSELGESAATLADLPPSRLSVR